jgi:hypothetical protein
VKQSRVPLQIPNISARKYRIAVTNRRNHYRQRTSAPTVKCRLSFMAKPSSAVAKFAKQSPAHTAGQKENY